MLYYGSYGQVSWLPENQKTKYSDWTTVGTYQFKGNSAVQSSYNIVTLANMTDNAAAVKSAIGSISPTLIVSAGNMTQSFNSESDFGKYLKYMSDITSGSYPVLFLRGESETKGAFAAEMNRYMRTNTGSGVIGQYYGDYKYGDLSIIGLDTATVNKDSYSAYNNMVQMDSLRQKQAQWLKNGLDESFTGKYNIVFANSTNLTEHCGVNFSGAFSHLGINLTVGATVGSSALNFNGSSYASAVCGDKTDANDLGLLITCSEGKIEVKRLGDKTSLGTVATTIHKSNNKSALSGEFSKYFPVTKVKETGNKILPTAMLVDNTLTGVSNGTAYKAIWDGTEYTFTVGKNAFATIDAAISASTASVPQILLKSWSGNLTVNGAAEIYAPNYNTSPFITDGYGVDSHSKGVDWKINPVYLNNSLDVDSIIIGANASDKIEIYGLTMYGEFIDTSRATDNKKTTIKLINTLKTARDTDTASRKYIFQVGNANNTSNYNSTDELLVRNLYILKTAPSGRLIGEPTYAYTTFDGLFCDVESSGMTDTSYIKNYNKNSVFTVTNSNLRTWHSSGSDNGRFVFEGKNKADIASGETRKLVFTNNVLHEFANKDKSVIYWFANSFSDLTFTGNLVMADRLGSQRMMYSTGLTEANKNNSAYGTITITDNAFNGMYNTVDVSVNLQIFARFKMHIDRNYRTTNYTEPNKMGTAHGYGMYVHDGHRLIAENTVGTYYGFYPCYDQIRMEIPSDHATPTYQTGTYPFEYAFIEKQIPGTNTVLKKTAMLVSSSATVNGSTATVVLRGITYGFNVGENAFSTIDAAIAAYNTAHPGQTPQIIIDSWSGDITLNDSAELFAPDFETRPYIDDGYAELSYSGGANWKDNPAYKSTVTVRDIIIGGSAQNTVGFYGFTFTGGIVDNSRPIRDTKTVISIVNCLKNGTDNTNKTGNRVMMQECPSVKDGYNNTDETHIINLYVKKTSPGWRLVGMYTPSLLVFDGLFVDATSSGMTGHAYLNTKNKDAIIIFKNSNLRRFHNHEGTADGLIEFQGNEFLSPGNNDIKVGETHKIVYDNNILHEFGGKTGAGGSGPWYLVRWFACGYSDLQITGNYIDAGNNTYASAANDKDSICMFHTDGIKASNYNNPAFGTVTITDNVINGMYSGFQIDGWDNNVQYFAGFDFIIKDNFRIENRVDFDKLYSAQGQNISVNYGHYSMGNIEIGSYWLDSDKTIPSVTISAEANVPTVNMNLRVQDACVSLGDIFEVDVVVESNPGFNHLKLNLDYNSTALEFLGAANGTVSSDYFNATSTALIWESDEDTNSVGTLATLRFRAKNTSLPGSHTLGVSLSEACSCANQNITCSVLTGNITVNSIAQITATADKDAAYTGETFNVMLNITDNHGFNSLALDLIYDTDVLELVSTTNGNVSSGMTDSLIWNTDTNATGDGLLATLTFKAKENIKSGNYAIDINLSSAANQNGNISIKTYGTNINVTNAIVGDVNLDGIVNCKDTVMIKMYLSDTANISTYLADFNKDGTIDSKDIAAMSEYISKL